jgi:hypothetical protein
MSLLPIKAQDLQRGHAGGKIFYPLRASYFQRSGSAGLRVKTASNSIRLEHRSN